MTAIPRAEAVLYSTAEPAYIYIVFNRFSAIFLNYYSTPLVTVAKIKVVLFICVHMYTASKRIKLEIPGCSGFKVWEICFKT